MYKLWDNPDELVRVLKILWRIGSVDLAFFVDVFCEWAKSHPEAIKKITEKLRYANEAFWDKLASIGINVNALKRLIEILYNSHDIIYDRPTLLKLIRLLWKNEDIDKNSDTNKCSSGKLMSKL